MEKRKASLILVILGFIVIIVLPLVFFIFGWHSVDVACERNGQSVNCRIEENFAAGLYVREAIATEVTGIGYKTHQSHSTSGSGARTVLTSGLVFGTSGGSVDITVISSNTADDAKKQLILAFRAWQDSSSSQPFAHHADMVDIFGWLGGIGVAFWAWVLLSWPYYLWKQKKAAQP